MEMEVDHKKIIQKNYEFLIDSLDPDPLASHLFSENKITPTQHESILEKTRRAASNECLKILMKSRSAFNSFIKFLKLHDARSFIFETLEKDMVEEIRIVMIGKTGVGKSLLGNNILDHKSFSSLGCSQSVTTQNKRGERMIDKYCKLVLVDTPGLCYTNTKDNMETAKILASTVKQTDPGPHIFLLVVSIGRFTAEERATVEFLKDIFGSHVTDYLIIIFTGKDTLDFDKMDFETYISTARDDLKSIVEQCQERMTINNRASREEVTQNVNYLLQMIKRVYLQNEKQYYTDELLDEAQKTFEEKLRLQEEEAHRRERELEEEMKKVEEGARERETKLEEEKKKVEVRARERERKLEEVKKKLEKEKKKLEEEKRYDKNRMEYLIRDNEEIQKKYEDERKEKQKLRLQTEEAFRRERKMEEEMKNLKLKSRDHDKDMVEEIRVVIFGKTGVGKSMLANNILEKEKWFASRGAAWSTAKEAKRGERMIDKYCKLVLVDTPGLFDTNNKDNMETAKILASTVRETKPGPHVFIFVLSMLRRYTPEENAAIEFLKDLFGSHVTDYLIIVFTGKDTIDCEKLDFETYIDMSKDDLKYLVSQSRGRVAINNWASPEEITPTVDELLQLIKCVYLQNEKQHFLHL